MRKSDHEQIIRSILSIRDQRVILDSELARVYGVPTKRLNEQIKRNIKRFPPDFMFQLTKSEKELLRSQFATSNLGAGGRRYLPYVFTEHGALMAANVLNSEKAITTSIHLVRAFMELRKILVSHKELSERLSAIEAKYDHQFKVVFDSIRALLTPQDPPRRKIGIRSDSD